MINFTLMRTESEIKELEEKINYIKLIRGEHHSAYKQAVMELKNNNSREYIDYEYNSAIRLTEKSGLINKL